MLFLGTAENRTILPDINLTPEQQQAYLGLCWLLDPKREREGRTFVTALALIRTAIENPEKPVPITDHVANSFASLELAVAHLCKEHCPQWKINVVVKDHYRWITATKKES